VLLECFGEELERGDVPWADDAEGACDPPSRPPAGLGDRDHSRVNDAEGKAHVLLDELRDARDVAFLDLSIVEAVAAE
jgi:hypothetical protein